MMDDVFFWEVNQLKQCLAVLRHSKSLDELDEKFCKMIEAKEKMIDNPINYLEEQKENGK